MASDRAVFLDRDGVINIDRGYVHRPAQFEFIAGVVPALARLQNAGWRLVVVTNQSGIARGLYTEDDYQHLTQHMQQQLAEQGVQLDAVLHCPHGPAQPGSAVASHRTACDCRKPQPGLLLQAARDLGLDLARSVMVGDRLSDMQAGRAAGVGRCLLVGNAVAADTPAAMAADAVLADLAACTTLLRAD